MKTLRDTGYRPTGINFRGYNRVKKHQYEIVQEEATLIKRAFEPGVANLPYTGIARRLRKEFGWKDAHYDTLISIYNRPEYAGYQYDSKMELIESVCFKFFNK